jgi:hypothetical protein
MPLEIWSNGSSVASNNFVALLRDTTSYPSVFHRLLRSPPLSSGPADCQQALVGRRRRRRYTHEFKAQVVAVCQGQGVSLAAIALQHKVNANLLRRWVEQAEGNGRELVAGSDVAVRSAVAPAFVPVSYDTGNVRPAEIRV